MPEETGVVKEVELAKVEKKKGEYRPKFSLEKIPDIKKCSKCGNRGSLFKFNFPAINASDYFISCSNGECKHSTALKRVMDFKEAIHIWNRS